MKGYIPGPARLKAEQPADEFAYETELMVQGLNCDQQRIN